MHTLSSKRPYPEPLIVHIWRPAGWRLWVDFRWCPLKCPKLAPFGHEESGRTAGIPWWLRPTCLRVEWCLVGRGYRRAGGGVGDAVVLDYSWEGECEGTVDSMWSRDFGLRHSNCSIDPTWCFRGVWTAPSFTTRSLISWGLGPTRQPISAWWRTARVLEIRSGSPRRSRRRKRRRRRTKGLADTTHTICRQEHQE